MNPQPEDIPLPPDEEFELPPISQIPPPPDEIPLPEDPPLPPGEPPLPQDDPPPLREYKNTRIRNKRKHPDDEAVGFSKEEEAAMLKYVGITSFNSTKGKQVPGNNVGSVHVVRKRRYRQYMNRKGGFNRPLDKVA